MGVKDEASRSGAETDEGGSHFDGHTDDFDFDDDDGILIVKAKEALEGAKKFVLQPMLIGCAAAFGMSIGYALYDFTRSVFRGSSASSK
mmetsp:Transcript_6312/g.19060  ORF Transcript_6312/g.19060 Transcript_6312/m.19060 type:complete len:89 (+) Transcript_6312:198-464(+)